MSDVNFKESNIEFVLRAVCTESERAERLFMSGDVEPHRIYRRACNIMSKKEVSDCLSRLVSMGNIKSTGPATDSLYSVTNPHFKPKKNDKSFYERKVLIFCRSIQAIIVLNGEDIPKKHLFEKNKDWLSSSQIYKMMAALRELGVVKTIRVGRASSADSVFTTYYGDAKRPYFFYLYRFDQKKLSSFVSALKEKLCYDVE